MSNQVSNPVLQERLIPFAEGSQAPAAKAQSGRSCASKWYGLIAIGYCCLVYKCANGQFAPGLTLHYAVPAICPVAMLLLQMLNKETRLMRSLWALMLGVAIGVGAFYFETVMPVQGGNKIIDQVNLVGMFTSTHTMTALWFVLRFLMPADTPTELMSYGSIAGLAMLSVVPVCTQGVNVSYTAELFYRINFGKNSALTTEFTRALLLVPFQAAVCGIMGGVVADKKFNLVCCSLLRGLAIVFPFMCLFAVAGMATAEITFWTKMIETRDWRHLAVPFLACTNTLHALYKNKKWARYFNHIAAIDAMAAARNYGMVADAQVHV